ncbi:MAG: formylglycine-generating enzyme family protein [Elainellaceae cyanobacterium]
MKRRKFFQYVGLGSVGYLVAAGNQSIASAFVASPDGQQYSNPEKLSLSKFDFDVTTLDQFGQLKHQQKHSAQFFTEPVNSTETLELVAIAPGQFWMGASRTEAQAKDHEFPRHRVTLSPFFISKYPTTQAQWAAVAALPKVQRELPIAPSHFQGSDRPVESVSWLDAMEFCDRLSQHTGRRYQLPSEAQWEYACRAGTQTPFSTGETITSQFADYVGTYTYKSETVSDYRQATLPVGQLSPNAHGLHDMHGNVWEWCADQWHANYRGAPANGQPWVSAQQPSPMRTIRGGGWLDAPANIRSASRSSYRETGLNRTIGFRVSMV